MHKKVLTEQVLYHGDVSMPDYIKEYIHLKFKLSLFENKITGEIYRPGKITLPLLNVNPIDLVNSSDYTMLYGVHVKDCMVRIHYDHNRRAGRSWDIPLTNNKFLLFPSTNMYCITNNQKDSMNFIQTITYDYRDF